MRHPTARANFVFACIIATIHLATARATGAPAKETPVSNAPSNSQLQSLNEGPAQYLRAGPIRLKFENGELRYLRVGEKEIVRRIYFSVRDGNWGTALPKFSQMQVEKGDDHFTIHLAARHTLGALDFQWKGTVTGAADGKITFHATGTPNADFDSNRIGLCVLFGARSLSGQDFQTDGKFPHATFPLLVSAKLVGERFHTLTYATPDGLKVSCKMQNATFDMEDQRNWGDNSWKAYGPLPYAYKHVTKGDEKSQTVTISVNGAKTADAAPAAQDPVRVRIGKPIAGSRVPVLVAVGSIVKPAEFVDISFHRDKYADKKDVSWSYIPTTHLPDDDTIMENLPAVATQLKTVRKFNTAGAKLHVGPIHLVKQGHDPRGQTAFGAAWAAGMMKYLSMGAAEEAAFDLGDGPAHQVLDALRPYGGDRLLAVETVPEDPRHVVAFALAGQQDETAKAIFLVNQSAEARHVRLEELKSGTAHVVHLGVDAPVAPAPVRNGEIEIELAPSAVVEVRFARKP